MEPAVQRCHVVRRRRGFAAWWPGRLPGGRVHLDGGQRGKEWTDAGSWPSLTGRKEREYVRTLSGGTPPGRGAGTRPSRNCSRQPVTPHAAEVNRAAVRRVRPQHRL